MPRCFSFSTIRSLSSVTSADNRKRFGSDITIPLLAPCSSYDVPSTLMEQSNFYECCQPQVLPTTGIIMDSIAERVLNLIHRQKVIELVRQSYPESSECSSSSLRKISN